MRKYLSVLTTLLAGALICCTRMPAECPSEPASDPVPAEFSLLLSAPEDSDTKSRYRESDLMAIKNVWVMSICQDGFWRTDYFTESALTRDGTWVRCPSISFRAGSAVSLFIAANMGDLTDQAFADGVPNPEQVEYLLPDPVDFAATAMPMAAQTQLIVPTSLPVQARLEPLLAKLRVSIDKNGITSNTPARVLASGELTIQHANRRMRPFGASTALDSSDLFSMEIDQESFAEATSYDMTHADIILYVPENVHGSGPVADRERCTYITYTCSKNAENDGVGGDLAFNAYLVNSASLSYSVLRNATYNCTLNLSWDGLFLDGDWRIDNSNLNDGRLLTLSPVANTANASFTDLGSLHREHEASLYVNFSRDEGATWVHAAKDIDTWPYGWDLYIDGVKQTSGASASAEGDLGWVYTGAASGDRIAITPGLSAVPGESHTVQVKSADGRVVSNVVRFQVGQNGLVGRWMDSTAPLYVAQCGQILCIDPDTDDLFTDGVICSTDPSKISVLDHGDGTADVSILAPFEAGEAGIYLTDAEGDRRCDMDLEGLLPYWKCTQSGDASIYVDQTFSKRISFCATDDEAGTTEFVQNRLRLVQSGYATGKYLNYGLLTTLLTPSVTSDNQFIGLSKIAFSSFGLDVTMQIQTYNGLTFGAAEDKRIDSYQLILKDFGHTRSALQGTVTAWNPFYSFSSQQQGSVMEDYTLYRFPDNDYGWDDSQRWSAHSYTDTKHYTMNVPRVIIENASHARLRAYFNDDGRVFGAKMLSGTPSRTASTQMTYSMDGIRTNDLVHHGAGRVNFNMDIVHAVDGSVLTKTFGYAFIRLHAFIYGEVYWGYGGKFMTAPNILHGNSIVNGEGLFPQIIYFNPASAISAPTWPYFKGSPSEEEDEYMIRAWMESDGFGNSLLSYPELETDLPHWVGRNRHGEEAEWYLPEYRTHLPASKQSDFVKACVRRSELPYTFSTSYEHSMYTNVGFYRVGDKELQYDPTWQTTKTYTLPLEIESRAAKRRLLVLHVIEGIMETNSSFQGQYQAAPENGNAGWYFSYENRTAF